MSNNKETSTASDLQQQLNNIANMLANCASKEDIGNFTKEIETIAAETTSKLERLDERVENVTATCTLNTDRIESLEAAVESLKQDQLKNNLCVSGVPAELVKDNNSADAVIAIAKVLGVELTRQQFTSYTVANDKFIIVNVFNIKYKKMMMNKIRAKKSLMVEEAFKHKSNSQIYLNDHLTPYYSSLFLLARRAKKEGKISSVSSYGGKIRARKSQNEAPIVITTEKQLQALIDLDYDSCSESDNSVQLIGNEMKVNQTSSTQSSKRDNNNNNTAVNKPHSARSDNNKNPHSHKRNTERKHQASQATKRKYESSGERIEHSKKNKKLPHARNQLINSSIDLL